MSQSPKVVLWDIETSHNLAAVFQLAHNDYINPENLIQERYVICAAWKTLGERAVSAIATTDSPKRYAKDPHDDLHVVTELHRVLSEADVIVAHNGDQYDLKFTEGRMLYHGLPPLPPMVKIDTLKEARNRFLLNSNKLDYLRVLQGDADAVKEMVRYNKQDVVLLERVFLKLQPYMANHINRHLFGALEGCPRCGSKDSQSRGTHRSTTRTYQRYQCKGCGGWFRSIKAEPAQTKVRVL
jgi:DNA polymerase elongation subunit (family B)